MLPSNFDISCASVQVAQDGIPQVGADEPRGRHDTLEDREPRGSPLPLCDGDCSIQRVQRRRGQALEDRIELGDLLPAGLLERRRKAMLGGDAGLCVKARELFRCLQTR